MWWSGKGTGGFLILSELFFARFSFISLGLEFFILIRMLLVQILWLLEYSLHLRARTSNISCYHALRMGSDRPGGSLEEREDVLGGWCDLALKSCPRFKSKSSVLGFTLKWFTFTFGNHETGSNSSTTNDSVPPGCAPAPRGLQTPLQTSCLMGRAIYGVEWRVGQRGRGSV